MAIEVSTKRALSMLVHLLKRFYDTTIVTVDQLDQVRSKRMFIRCCMGLERLAKYLMNEIRTTRPD